MNELIDKVSALRNSEIRNAVDNRMKEFANLRRKGNDEWFSELCFCLLTANSRADSAIRIQNQLGSRGFLNSPQQNISETIRMNKHRFHNNKAKFIVEARKFRYIKNILKDKNDFEAREFLVDNVKGLGMKEASHFLRNVGYNNLSILDRHILSLMDEKHKALSKKKYLEIEEKFLKLAGELKILPGELDLYMWYMKTGIVLK